MRGSQGNEINTAKVDRYSHKMNLYDFVKILNILIVNF